MVSGHDSPVAELLSHRAEAHEQTEHLYNNICSGMGVRIPRIRLPSLECTARTVYRIRSLPTVERRQDRRGKNVALLEQIFYNHFTRS